MRVLYSTWPDADTAQACGAQLVDEHLAACVTILPGAISVYRWQGTVETASEAVMLAKTDESRADAAAIRLAQLHPYDQPVCLALPVEAQGTLPGAVAWIRQSVGATGHRTPD